MTQGSLNDEKPANASRLGSNELRRRVDPDALPGPRACARHRTHIIGQDRAIQALELGLKLEGPGYNVFLAGPSGSGRMTTARHILASFKEPRRPLRDFAYVFNFQEPDRPRLLVLPPGDALRLKKGMEKLVFGLRSKLPQALSLEACQKQRDRLRAEYHKREDELLAGFQRRVREAGFALVCPENSQSEEIDVLPLVDGKPQTTAALEERMAKGKLAERRRRQIDSTRNELRLECEQVYRRARLLARQLGSVLDQLDRQIGTAVIDGLVEELKEQFDSTDVLNYLDEVGCALTERISALVREDPEQPSATAPPVDPSALSGGGGDVLAPFQVNVVLCNARRKDCPVVFERNPTLVRLFGTIERGGEESGNPEAAFMNIRAGSLLRADGGFLVANSEDALVEPGVWMALKRSLSTSLLDVRTPDGAGGMPPSALKPDPIPIDVKVVLLGDDDVYRTLYLEEDDFKKTFKVKAEFDVDMVFSRTNLEKYLAFVSRVTREEKLLAPTHKALALLVEESIRDAENRDKLSTRFRLTADLLRESSYWARAARRRQVAEQDVERALGERYRRINLVEEKYRESIERGVILVATSGRRTGQINGLTVFDLGDYSFGKPCRITASVGVGREGIINIERECGLSGESHDKGVYVLTGFLRNRFGSKVPLALDASICIEQSYGPVDGDSASSTEMYAILSCLAELPLSQGIAVTGSVSQHGDIQPIGGINQKIEGFFEICQARELDGTQGVLIPRRNTDHLMLRSDVVEAVRRGLFHVWAISTVDEGMEILCGVPAGERQPDGEYPPGTVNARVLARLRSMAEEMRRYQTLQ
ncbi:MAG: AAA family ATPase [Pseudomonadota bacterium]